MSKQIGAKRRVIRTHDTAHLELAVAAVKSNSMSIRAASRLYSIPRATLFDKVSGRTPLVRSSKTVLTAAEEQLLVDWILQMARIGYGRTRQEVLNTVKRILEADKRPNPFKENRPGKDWWYGFTKRHPGISERLPQQLGKQRAIVTQEKVNKWFDDYQDYVINELKDPSLLQDPSRLYNADESGFSFCPKTGKVLAKKGTSTVYNFTSSDKTQITVLACMGATGHFLKPLIVYPGQRFAYNPLEEFPDAIMGRTDNGWMDSELFITWLSDVFIPSVNERGIRKPVMLFVDGHSTHMSMKVSDLCKENGVELYCLLEHASHLMQPCDLRLFSGLKSAWKQAVRDFQFHNVGEHVNKKSFARVFRQAWEKSTTLNVAVHGFRDAGIFPLDPSKVLGTSKMDPSTVFTCKSSSIESTKSQCVETINTTTINPSDADTLTNSINTNSMKDTVDTRLQTNSVGNPKSAPSTSDIRSDIPHSFSDLTTSSPGVVSKTLPSTSSSSSSISASFEQFLTTPSAKKHEKKTVRRDFIPKAITGGRFRILMEEKQKRKDQLEAEKNERKRQRELKKEQREKEKQARLEKKEAKKKEKEEQRLLKLQKKRVKEIEKKFLNKNKGDISSDSSIDMSDFSDGSEMEVDIIPKQCYICEEEYDDSPFWISCNRCPREFHRRCVKSIDLCIMTEDEIEALQFECDFC